MSRNYATRNIVMSFATMLPSHFAPILIKDTFNYTHPLQEPQFHGCIDCQRAGTKSSNANNHIDTIPLWVGSRSRKLTRQDEKCCLNIQHHFAQIVTAKGVRFGEGVGKLKKSRLCEAHKKKGVKIHFHLSPPRKNWGKFALTRELAN